MDVRLLTFDELKGHGVLLGRRQVDRLEAENKFPKRVPISGWRVAWVREEVDAWVTAKIESRDMDVGTLGAGGNRSRRKRV